MAFLTFARAGAALILDFALPARCPGCGMVVADQHSFCLDCWRALDILAEPCCFRCGTPFFFDQGEEAECGACIVDPPAFDRLRAAVAYGPIARQVALKLKYARRTGTAHTLAQFMIRHASGLPEEAILVPVPLHRWRIWNRGYNQAALIASAVGRRSGRRVELDLLRRVKQTPSLRGLGRKARSDAMRGAFVVPPGKRPLVSGKDLILIDDVYTTGATASACACALKKAGAARVNILCWARVIRSEEN